MSAATRWAISVRASSCLLWRIGVRMIPSVPVCLHLQMNTAVSQVGVLSCRTLEQRLNDIVCCALSPLLSFSLFHLQWICCHQNLLVPALLAMLRRCWKRSNPARLGTSPASAAHGTSGCLLLHVCCRLLHVPVLFLSQFASVLRGLRVPASGSRRPCCRLQPSRQGQRQGNSTTLFVLKWKATPV